MTKAIRLETSKDSLANNRKWSPAFDIPVLDLLGEFFDPYYVLLRWVWIEILVASGSLRLLFL